MTEYRCPNVAVIGAGVVGLSTALQLKQQLPQAKVTVLADHFSPNTTSDGAAGIVRPYGSKVPGVPFNVFRQWLRDSWQYFHGLAHSEDAGEAGCKVVSGMELYHKPPDTSLTRDIMYSHVPCTEKELQMYPGPKYKFKEKGGTLVNEKVTDLSELVGKYDCVVLCVGYGAKQLLKDEHMYAVRGHLIRVAAPWLKECVFADGPGNNCTYIYPGQDNVIVGGTRQKHDEDLTPRAEEQAAVWQRACQLVPSLQKAEVLCNWVGLRPTRWPLKLEKETLQFHKGQLQVVHNFGHGGEGVSLSWGTAKVAVELVKEQLKKCSRLEAKL